MTPEPWGGMSSRWMDVGERRRRVTNHRRLLNVNAGRWMVRGGAGAADISGFRHVAWSPDGSRIADYVEVRPWRICVVDLTGKKYSWAERPPPDLSGGSDADCGVVPRVIAAPGSRVSVAASM